MAVKELYAYLCVRDAAAAIDFYRRLGAKLQDEWHVHELEDGPLHALASGGDGEPGG